MPHKEDTAPATQSDLATLQTELLNAIREEGKTTRRHFDIAAESFRDDVIGAFSDRTAQFEQTIYKLSYRVRAIERKLELAS